MNDDRAGGTLAGRTRVLVVPAAVIQTLLAAEELWIVGRIAYFFGYVSEANKRFPGFAIQALTSAILLFGALGRAIWVAAGQG